VTGAQQRVVLRTIQTHRATGMRADLRVADDAVGRPGLPVGGQLQIGGAQSNEQRLAVGAAGRALRKDRLNRVDAQIARPYRATILTDDAGPFAPSGLKQGLTRLGSERKGRQRQGGGQQRAGATQHAHQEPAP